jgi:YD repeat-containing protein
VKAPLSAVQPVGAGLVHEERNPNDLLEGTLTLRCYDVFGRVVLEHGPNGLAETTWAYDDTPGAAAVTESRLASDAGGQLVTTADLDGAGRIVGTASSGPQNQMVVTATAYDLVGRVWTQTAPHFEGVPTPPPTTLAYDPLDRLVQTTRPGARIETTDYDRGLITSTDANLNVRERVVDPFGNVIDVREVTSEGTFVTGYEFDLLDRLTRITDHLQNETVIGYDLLGRRRLLDDPDTGVTTFFYDPNGNLTKRIGPLGAVEWTYDALDRPKTQRLNGSFSDDVTWQYDTATGGIGQLAARSDRVGVYQALVYDGLGRVFQERWTAGGSHHAFTTLYDPLGQVTRRTYPAHPGSRTVDWVRDGRGFLTAIETDDGASQYASAITWDAEGRPTAWTTGNDVDTTVGFDPTTSRLDSIEVRGATLLEHLSYQYDDGDRVEIITDLRNQLRNQGFE